MLKAIALGVPLAESTILQNLPNACPACYKSIVADPGQWLHAEKTAEFIDLVSKFHTDLY